MSNPTKEEIKAAFKIADKDGNGKLSASEVKALMGALGEDVDDADIDDNVKMIMSMADTDGDKMLKIEEVISILCGEVDEKDVMKAMFNMCDADGNGKLTRKELVELSKVMGGGEEDERSAQMLLGMADKDRDGMLSFEEWMSFHDYN